eukprot:scaffold107865_cov18-Tisochrysis_lutea.AAC.2
MQRSVHGALKRLRLRRLNVLSRPLLLTVWLLVLAGLGYRGRATEEAGLVVYLPACPATPCIQSSKRVYVCPFASVSCNLYTSVLPVCGRTDAYPPGLL